MSTSIRETGVSMPESEKRLAQNEGMVLIPAGTFVMGSDDGSEFERPVHEVYLDDFWMDETPVTNSQFAEFARDTGYRTEAERLGRAWGFRDGEYRQVEGLYWRTYAIPERQEHPVVLVSWNDALAYANWVGKQLPTEAQWEKAARGGLQGKLYPWGDESPDGTQSNFARPQSEFPLTTEARSFAPNPYGLCDMVGNVWQWCADEFGPYVGPEGQGSKPSGAEYRVRRGGAWNVIQSFRLRCANRGALGKESAFPNVGFRCQDSNK